MADQDLLVLTDLWKPMEGKPLQSQPRQQKLDRSAYSAGYDATDAGAFETVLQQGCCPVPLWQSPAIFLQHSISEGVICGFGRQASTGELTHRQIRAIPMMW